MSPRRVAMLSLHTSPLAQPGTGDGGGMNVYVRSLAAALVRAGVECDLVTRADHPGAEPVVDARAGVRVVHLDAGPRRPVAEARPRRARTTSSSTPAERWLRGPGGADVLHAHYWIAGAVAHALKHRLGVPMVATFHTLAQAKADAGIHDDPAHRQRAEADIVRCADGLVVSTFEERDLLVERYDAVPDRIEIIPPGVDHAVFTPGDCAPASAGTGGPDRDPVLLFVGRIQPLKGVDLAVQCLAALEHPRAQLVVVGGPSGADGDAELARVHGLARDLGVADRVRFEPARAHDDLACYYRAADVVLVPSRTESFGLVALEAAACGTPVVASSVGGLARHRRPRSERVPRRRSRPARVRGVRPRRVARSTTRAPRCACRPRRARAQYTWSIAAARLRRLYADVPARELVRCT